MYAKPTTFADHSHASDRAQHSKRLIELTFRELLARKPFAQITAADVADAAGLARSTLYRRWAGLEQLLWSIMRPHLEAAIRRALAGEMSLAAGELRAIWDIAGVIPALQHSDVARTVRQHLATLIAAEIERRCAGRDASASGVLIAGSIVAFMLEYSDAASIDTAQLEELTLVLYVSSFMTPRALEAAARERARAGATGRFPPAVSARESLASDDYILSMIDGRPYRSLTRHIGRFGLTPDEYRRCFDLPETYPMVARRYSARRSEIARNQIARRRSAPDARQAVIA